MNSSADHPGCKSVDKFVLDVGRRGHRGNLRIVFVAVVNASENIEWRAILLDRVPS